MRVGEILRHALAALFLRASFYEPPLKDVTLTVTRVEVSSDLRVATVFVVPFGGENMEEVCGALKKLEPFFRSRLNQAVRLRYIPSLRFKGDRSFDHAHRIEQTLKHIHQNRATS